MIVFSLVVRGNEINIINILLPLRHVEKTDLAFRVDRFTRSMKQWG